MNEVNNKEDYDNLIKPIMIAAKLVCFWPLERDHPTSATLFRICHLFCLFLVFITMCVTVTADIIHNLDNLDEFTECALLSSVFYLTVIRLTVYSLHQEDMLYVVETMKEDWVRSSYNDRLILRKKCLFAFRLTKCFIIMVVGTIFGFSFIPLLEIHFLGAKKILPFRGHFFNNQTISPVYECLYFFNAMSGWLAAGTITGATGFALVAITHGSAKFALLRNKLEAMSSNDPDADRTMTDCIKRHRDAITFADALERILNVLALGQFIISTGLVCFAGFQITSMIENKARLMKYSSFMNAAVLELFMFSLSGNGLIDESSAVGESAYRSDWIGSTFSRNLQIVMMRSRVPSRITAAKFYSMSINSFAKVLNTSFSYMMVLMTTKEE